MGFERLAHCARRSFAASAPTAAGLALALCAGAGALPAQELTCADFKKRAAPRHQAEEIWRTEPGIRPAELASRVGATKKETRHWIDRWQRKPGAEERDCKRYPSRETATAEAGAGQGEPDPDKAMRSFLDRLSQSEEEACRPRLEACYYFIVDCRLPPRLRRIGRRMPSISPRRSVRTTAGECKKRAGVFRLSDASAELVPAPGERAAAGPFRLVVRYGYGSEREISPPGRRSTGPRGPSPETSWERDANLGKACARNYLGEIHQTRREYDQARERFAEAAAQGYPEALINLGNLYELGLGVAADPLAALDCYAAATGDDGLLLAEIDENLPTEIREEIKTRATRAGKLSGPSIEVVDPWFPASRPQVRVGDEDTERRLFGRIFAVADLRTLELAGGDDSEALAWEKDLSFEHRIPLPAEQDDFSFELTVTDKQGKTDPVPFRLRRGGAQPPPLPPVEAAEGSYYALLVGIGEYRQSDAFPKLDTPVSDARDLGDRLSRDWNFKSPVLLTDGDATFEKIVSRLDEFRRTLTEKDSLLVYFAGHGELEKDAFGNEGGYWIPHDADDVNRRTWISSRQIAHQVETLRAGNVLIMADACFSGFLTRSTISAAGGARSVSVLTSADESEALDKAAGGRSPFARAVLDVLGTWKEKLPASKLANRVAAAFSGYYRSCESEPKPEERAFCEALADYGQEPQFRPISEGGHEGGEFTFVPASR